MNKFVRCLTFVLSLALSGCDLPYYWQAAEGQWELVQQRKPIDQILADPTTPAQLKDKLSYLMTARSYAMEQLQLESNDSYLTYVDLGRDHVVWNVFATEELSMESKTWCYPIAGCVSYRGYFSEQDAIIFAEELDSQGFDTYVGGVGAYSTLGWFEDSVLSTFVSRSDTALAALLFHELAHQTLYVKNDTVFNESYASAVEQILLQHWLVDKPQQWQAYLSATARQQAFVKLILKNKRQRQELFQSDLEPEQMRAQKERLIAQLRQDYQAFKEQWNGFRGYDNWFSKDLNNAQISTVATYHELLPGFLALYHSTDQNLPSFIEKCQELVQLSKSERHQQLKQFASASIVYTQE